MAILDRLNLLLLPATTTDDLWEKIGADRELYDLRLRLAQIVGCRWSINLVHGCMTRRDYALAARLFRRDEKGRWFLDNRGN